MSSCWSRSAREAAAAVVLGIVPILLTASGCDGGDESGAQGVLQDSSLASLDVRGGVVEASSQFADPTVGGNNSGKGGAIRVTSSSGDIIATSAASNSTPQATLIVGAGIDVVPGQRRVVGGFQAVDFLRVQAGGSLVLAEDTIFSVTGDVDIAGSIGSNLASGGGDSHDLTIGAGGIINISGSIQLGGADNILSSARDTLGGGKGATVNLTGGTSTLAGNPGPHIFVSGIIDASGGDATELFSNLTSARAGKGGQIFLSTPGSVVVTGKLLARGGLTAFGNQSAFFDVTFADGGEIRIAAGGSVEVAAAQEINASGGDTPGDLAGGGGTITLEAPLGALQIAGVDLLCDGGNLTLNDVALAGEGGDVSLFADDVSLDDCTIDASGGGVTRDQRPNNLPVIGTGSTGGTVQMAALNRIDVSETVLVRSIGGATNFNNTPGGQGGEVAVINFDSADLSVVDFRGAIDVSGGPDAFGNAAADGTICQRGAGSQAVNQMTGQNQFPVGLCPVANDGSLAGGTFVVHDLDCDDTTLLPPTAVAEVPITGSDFFRVRVGAATSLTVATTGTDGGDIDIFAGAASAIGSEDPADYVVASTNPDSSTESLTVDLTVFTPGEFVTILVLERTPFVETYSIDVICQ